MNNIPEVINQTLEVLSSKFGTSFGDLWQIMVRQQLYEGWAHLVLGIVFGIIFIISLMGSFSFTNKNNDALFYLAMISFVCLIFASMLCYMSYMEFVNPEYQAIREFLDVLRK